ESGIWIEEFDPLPVSPTLTQDSEQSAVGGGVRSRPAVVKSEPATPKLSLEELLAGKWLTWVGAIAVVIGAGFAFKYAIDQQYLGPAGRVMLGLLAGMVCLVGGAAGISRDYRAVGQGLVGTALGILYMALYAAAQWYQLISLDVAFGGMIVVTATGLAISTLFRAEPVAILGLLGGFMTPLMLSTGADAPWVFFPYLLMLDVGVLGIALFRRFQFVSIVALAGTVLMWLGWLERHYAPEKFTLALGFMSLFFVVFALLGVVRNILRKEALTPLDLVVLLATPVFYFAGLYGITYKDYSAWQGLLAVGMGAIYLGLAAVALKRSPQVAQQGVTPRSRGAVLALGGIAASFLTVAIPLQLTGHWIAIAWAAEAVLLVEMGLYIRERKLRAAGFGLLIVVQLILANYTLETLDHPGRFSTRFLRDPVVDTVGVPTQSALEVDPSWTDVFNGRSLSFLASALAMGVLAWEYKRRLATGWFDLDPDASTASEASPSTVLDARPATAPSVSKSVPKRRGTTSPSRSHEAMIASLVMLGGVPVTLLVMLVVETVSFGYQRQWIGASFGSCFTVWTAGCAAAIAWLARDRSSRPLKWLAAGTYALLALLVAISLFDTLDRSNPFRYSYTMNAPFVVADSPWLTPLFNPRGVGLLAAIASAAWAAIVARNIGRAESESAVGADGSEGETNTSTTLLSPVNLLVTLAHLTGLVLVTTEVYSQGTLRDWGTGRSLGITLVWSLYAIVTLGFGIYMRSSAIRVLGLGLFVLTTAKVFLFDVWHLSTMIRTFAFIGLGVSLMLVGFLYRRFRDRIREWMAPSVLVIALGLSFSGATASAADGPSELARALSHRMEILQLENADGNSPRLARVSVPPEFYSTARHDLADLRILAGDGSAPLREIPFVVVHPQDVSTIVERSAKMLNLSESGDTTEFLLDASGAKETINSLLIQVDDASRNFERPVRIFGANQPDATDWNLLSDKGYLLDVSRPGHRMALSRIEFPTSRFPWYKVVVINNGEPPLKISGGKLFDRVETRAPRLEWEAKRLSAEHDAQRKESRFEFDLGMDGIPTSEAWFDVTFEGNFYRTVTLQVADDIGKLARWRLVGNSQLYSVSHPDLRARDTALSYAEARGRYLRLTIQNGDDSPVDVVRCRAFTIDRVLVVDNTKLRQTGNNPVGIYAGNERLGPPQYDLTRTIGPFTLEQLPALSVGPLEPNPLYTAGTPPGAPWSERHKPVLWGVTLLSVAVLGGLTVLILKKGANPPAG
ncbi:MAG: DUF2339 domain-containing protein, partial [Planctomycetota bacterium]|nr:DUF2339 domain-containing protein [Planctomycetota bacterium]